MSPTAIACERNGAGGGAVLVLIWILVGLAILFLFFFLSFFLLSIGSWLYGKAFDKAHKKKKKK